jgi:hypothetical protein
MDTSHVMHTYTVRPSPCVREEVRRGAQSHTIEQ